MDWDKGGNSRRESLACVTHGLLLLGMLTSRDLCTIPPVNIPHALITLRPSQTAPLKESYALNEGNIPNYFVQMLNLLEHDSMQFSVRCS